MCDTELEQCFPEELSVLRELFGDAAVQECLPRLNEIHGCTEATWRKSVGWLPDRLVRYILLAEAPPWPLAPAPPQYVFCPASRPRVLMKALRKAFSVPKSTDAGEAVKEFARRGLFI